MAFYQGAHSFTSRNANFIHVTNIRDPLTNATSILDENRAVEATHKSTTAEYAPKCNPKTRQAVIRDIMKWVGAPPAPKSILWFDGPAGAGKTCIMREVVVRREATPGMVAASYFFSTRVGRLTIERPFIATIAYQLAYSGVPGLKAAILQAISDNPNIFRDGLESQMDALIVEPLRECGFSYPYFAPSRRGVIIIDGLDECKEEPERKHLLGLLLSLANKLSHSLVIIIASRPELDIRMVFALEDFDAATHIVRLHDYDGTEDVRIFYCDEFEKVRQIHPLRHYIPVGWITEEVLQVLISKSSGHFIYPSVVMKYIAGHPRQNPLQLLEKAMAASSSLDTEDPLAELDALYTLILHPPDVDFPLMRRLLHAIANLAQGGYSTDPSFYDELFQLAYGATDAALCDLHSILCIPTSPYGSISFHHKSLEDFLMSSSRSKDLFQSSSDTYIDLTFACIRHLQSWARKPVKCSSNVIPFAAKRCMDYLRITAYLNEALPDAISGFDPRCLSECCFVHFNYQPTFTTPKFPTLREFVHKKHCAGRSEGIPLCTGLLVIYRSTGNIRRMVANDRSYSKEARLALLPKFKAESGLYSPECNSIKAAELSSRKRKLDSPDGPSGTWDPPRTRLTAKNIFACNFKDENPDAVDVDFERAWRKASKEIKADYRARADEAKAAKNASKGKAQKKLKASRPTQAYHQVQHSRQMPQRRIRISFHQVPRTGWLLLRRLRASRWSLQAPYRPPSGSMRAQVEQGRRDLLASRGMHGVGTSNGSTAGANLDEVGDSLVWKFHEHTGAVKALGWDPHVAGGTQDKHIRFRNVVNGTMTGELDTGSQVCNFIRSPTSHELVSTHGILPDQIRICKHPSLSMLASLTGHTSRVSYLTMSPDGETIVTGRGMRSYGFGMRVIRGDG